MLTDSQSSFTGRLTSKFSIKSLLNVPPHLKHVATLPCERSKIVQNVKNCHAQELSEANYKDSATQNSRKNSCSVMLVLFNSLTKMYRVAILKIPQYDSLCVFAATQVKEKILGQKVITYVKWLVSRPAHVVQWSDHLGAMCSRA